MKQYQQSIIIALMVLVLAAFMGKRYIKGWFPPPMKFMETSLTNIDSNQLFSIANFKGKVVIVSCYQTWCIDCARETPVLSQLISKINSDQFKVIYVSDEEVIKQVTFRQRFEANSILFAVSPKPLASLGIKSYPTTYLLNKKGEVIKTAFEGYDWLKEEAAIKKMLAE